MSEPIGTTPYFPELRRDLQIIPIKDNGRELLYFHDSLGYTPADFALHAAVKPLLSLFNGHYRVSDLLNSEGSDLKTEELEDFIRLLDQACLLYTPAYDRRVQEVETNFEKQTVREPSLSGSSYPSDPLRFSEFLSRQFSGSPHNRAIRPEPRALYAPHIDMRVGSKEYVDSFSKLRGLKPKKVLILATSHYAGHYGSLYEGTPFIGSAKSYKIPGKLFKTDREILNRFNRNTAQNGFTLSDRAHRVEHSIETHLVWLSAIWDHEFEIIPILVGALDELFYHNEGDLAAKLERFAAELGSILQNERDVFTLISGDLSHVGKKFGDTQAASEMKGSVSIRDQRFIDAATNGSSQQMLDLLAEDIDSTRICGFPPLYLFLKAAHCERGELLNYRWWDETERESAVSYGSILY